MIRSLILTVMLLTACPGVLVSQGRSKFRGSSPVAKPLVENLPEAAPCTLSPFQAISGTPFLLAKVTGEQTISSKPVSVRQSAKNSIGSSAISKQTASGMRNAVFFDMRDDTTTSLFPNNDTLILSLQSLTDHLTIHHGVPKTRESLELTSATEIAPFESPAPGVIRWHLVEYVNRDTNEDGVVSARDDNTLGIVDAGGQRFVEVIPQLGDVFAKDMVDAETLLVIHGTQVKQIAVRIHLPTRKIRSAKVLPNFGTR